MLIYKAVKFMKYARAPEGWYWMRVMDGGHKLVKGEKWICNTIT